MTKFIFTVNWRDYTINPDDDEISLKSGKEAAVYGAMHFWFNLHRTVWLRAVVKVVTSTNIGTYTISLG